MPVRFGPSPRPNVRQVLQFPLGTTRWLVLGSDRSFERETRLHWLSAEARSVPCTEEDCPWHHLKIRVCTYVPSLCFSLNGRAWKESVLPVNDGMSKILEAPRECCIYELQRFGKENSTVSWKTYEREKYSQPFAGFELLPSLEKIWGMYMHAVKTSPNPAKEKPRLFDESDQGTVAG